MSGISAFGVALITGIFGLAMVAVIVGQKAQTTSVLQTGGSALSSIIGAAVAPVSGSATNTYGSVGQTVAGVST